MIPLLQSDLSVQASEIALLKANEKRMLRDGSDYREKAKSLEEELYKLKASRSVEDLQKKVREGSTRIMYFLGLSKLHPLLWAILYVKTTPSRMVTLGHITGAGGAAGGGAILLYAVQDAGARAAGRGRRVQGQMWRDGEGEGTRESKLDLQN